MGPMYFWLAAFILFGVVEAATVSLTSIWFAVGALAALIAAALGAPLWLQVTLFILASAVSLALTRPLAKKLLGKRPVPTNTDRILGKTCEVTETIDNVAGTGAVYVDGKTWSARSRSGEVISAGALVQVLSIEGVKLMVALPTPAGAASQTASLCWNIKNGVYKCV